MVVDDEIVRRALAEDLGTGDVTSDATVPAGARATATITQKEPGVLFGCDVAELTFRLLDPDIRVTRLAPEGVWRDPGPVMELVGSARGLLAGERTALNFLQRLSGVATLAARCVAAVDGTGAQVLDTRKTTPGLRALEKAAVAAGGATNHRAGLYDAILIKENHISLAGGIRPAVAAARRQAPKLLLEVECRDTDEIDQALAAGVDRILLDNMTPDRLRAAVARVAGRVSLEASGGVTLDTLRDHAATGVQFVSMGSITHSAPALDLSLILSLTPGAGGTR
ncbi:MAG TPA: carboxylating nicotinate-nucleotide diphosphorylase [Solirubrobacteraceae bacterium]|jgi:nicotinate-nucleotide pyrophosphorylase (carboxylating)|nr:carboxylating nicotinate-nucleotide diphosphorylase [Solirubrobacteraceae bacterium]